MYVNKCVCTKYTFFSEKDHHVGIGREERKERLVLELVNVFYSMPGSFRAEKEEKLPAHF